ncbi:phage protein Gp13 family protein [Acinetobacter oleivorans]|uniref:phage protein Gp13 family protein n=1 Tax=Acinetobacter oleivorans TaxID=1148157 RepID=UPI00124D902A|nr:phage protein Gp13 family protein [Acinetobacter oleivorans]
MRRNNIEIRKPTERDIRILVENLRPADQEELKAYFSDNYDWIVKTCVKGSRDAWSVVVNGKLLFICGVGLTSLIGNIGCPWLLGTTHIKKYPIEFVKQSRSILREMLANYDALKNHVYIKNDAAIRFLKHLGFSIKEPVIHGANGELFHPFSITVAS